MTAAKWLVKSVVACLIAVAIVVSAGWLSAGTGEFIGLVYALACAYLVGCLYRDGYGHAKAALPVDPLVAVAALEHELLTPDHNGSVHGGDERVKAACRECSHSATDRALASAGEWTAAIIRAQARHYDNRRILPEGASDSDYRRELDKARAARDRINSRPYSIRVCPQGCGRPKLNDCPRCVADYTGDLCREWGDEQAKREHRPDCGCNRCTGWTPGILPPLPDGALASYRDTFIDSRAQFKPRPEEWTRP